MSQTSLRESPLRAEHEALGARMVPFAAWRMPVQYAGILPEHQATRSACGMFDISHMGQLLVTGPRAEAWLDRHLTNHAAALAPGACHYTLMLNERGGVIDDLILYRLEQERFLLIVNASKVEEDERRLRRDLETGVDLVNVSSGYAGLAVQGPNTVAVAAGLWVNGPPLPERNHVRALSLEEGEAYICRTGYTGEDGFEIFLPSACAATYWKRLLNLGVTPCGLGARDTLRLEMGYPLNGADLTAERTPLEAGLGFFVAMEKPDFTGKDVLLQQKADGVRQRLAALRMEGKGPPLRAGYAVYSGETQLGTLTSGCLSPSLGVGIGMGYLPREEAKAGRSLDVIIRERRFPVTTVKKPFYRPRT